MFSITPLATQTTVQRTGFNTDSIRWEAVQPVYINSELIQIRALGHTKEDALRCLTVRLAIELENILKKGE